LIIQAANRFGCTHQYIVTATEDGDQWLFVCEVCGHRTELLPLTHGRSFGHVLGFPSVGSEFSVTGNERSPQLPLIHSA